MNRSFEIAILIAGILMLSIELWQFDWSDPRVDNPQNAYFGMLSSLLLIAAMLTSLGHKPDNHN
ncbi:hypothetical protein [Croceiramulus getboli]|nr:hypothetical protein P8624_02325 [Flavobacteriaceae bacterium YJPT1-3]